MEWMAGMDTGTRAVARAVAFGLALALAAPALAQDDAPGGVDRQMIMNSEGFLAAHPDLRWRREGVMALERGEGDEAAAYFRRAARYGDKPSQAMLAELYWTGMAGVAADRAQAYAWMDLAGERGYTLFIAKREQYWASLSDAERARAVEVGRPLFDEYRDAEAKPRLARILKRERRNTTGSRTGFVGNLQVTVPGPGGEPQTILGSQYYDDTFWEPDRYWAWQDRTWKDPPTGRVDILPIERVRDADGEPAPTP
ncbi:hypothetical protein GCM10028862_21940 [Luteimonas pelagia]